MRFLAPEVLKARLDVILSMAAPEPERQSALRQWMEIEEFDDDDIDLLLADAAMEALPEADRLTAVVLLAHTFRDSLTEARNGLV